MKRRLFYVLPGLVGLLVLAWPAASTSAHVLAQDGSVTAVLHIAPDDNPVAKRPTRLEFAFADGSQPFHLQTCDCKVSLHDEKRTLRQVEISPVNGSATDGEATVTFPAIGVYTLVVEGSATPHHHESTKTASFSLRYIERVATSAGGAPARKSAAGLQALLISAALLVILIIIAYRQITFGGRYASAATDRPHPKNN